MRHLIPKIDGIDEPARKIDRREHVKGGGSDLRRKQILLFRSVLRRGVFPCD